MGIFFININISEFLIILFTFSICLSSHEERLGRKGSCDEILKTLKAESRGKGKKYQKSEEKEFKKIEKPSPDSKRWDGEDNSKIEECKLNSKISLGGADKETKSDMDMLSPDLSNDEKTNFNFVSSSLPLINDVEDNNDGNQNEVFDDTRQNENISKSDKIPDFIEGLMKLQNKDEAIAKIRNGWSLENSHSLTLGDLYLMVSIIIYFINL